MIYNVIFAENVNEIDKSMFDMYSPMHIIFGIIVIYIIILIVRRMKQINKINRIVLINIMILISLSISVFWEIIENYVITKYESILNNIFTPDPGLNSIGDVITNMIGSILAINILFRNNKVKNRYIAKEIKII